MDPLAAVEAFRDALPRQDARAEDVGGLRLFVPQVVGRPWWAVPVGPRAVVTLDDVRRVRDRQQQLGLPVALEWVAGRPAGLEHTALAAGLVVHEHPLLVVEPGDLAPAPEVAAEVRLLTRQDDVTRADAVARVAFTGHDDTAGVEALDAVQESDASAAAVRTAQSLGGRPVLASAYVDGEPVARAACTMEGRVAEVTGVATLPAFRGRGLAAAVVRLLAGWAFDRGALLVFVTADSESVARLYARLGMTRVGSAWIAGAPA